MKDGLLKELLACVLAMACTGLFQIYFNNIYFSGALLLLFLLAAVANWFRNHPFGYQVLTVDRKMTLKLFPAGQFQSTVFVKERLLKSQVDFIGGLYDWSGGGTSSSPHLVDGDGVELFTPHPNPSRGMVQPYYLYNLFGRERGEEFSYVLEFNHFDPNYSLKPFYSFVVLRPCNSLTLCLDASATPNVINGSSLCAEEMKKKHGLGQLEYRFVSTLTIESVASNIWMVTIGKPKIGHRYVLQWEWTNGINGESAG